ncbi:MAG: hypothetical protein FWF22_05660, partial [Treponema sp.]|nr:hypothetical protein [Treponema sp.]
IDFIVTGGSGNSLYSRTDILKFVQQGVILPIQDLIDTDTIHMKEGFDKIPGIKESFTLPDGSMYVPPAYAETYHAKYYGKLWVNMVFLDNLKMTIPTTIQEFHDMLTAFKTKDANGNGDPNDEVPFAGAIDHFSAKVDTFLMSAFVYDDGENRLYLDNGKVTAAFTQPAFRDGLRYLAQLYSEGLIYPDSFIWRRDARAAFNSQKYESLIGVMGMPHHGNAGTREAGQPVRWIDYRPITPLKGPNGLQITRYDYYPTDEATSGFLPVTCSNPALVLRYLDWMYTDEGMTAYYYGGKGIGWTDADPGATGPAGTPATIKQFTLKDGDKYYGNLTWGNGLPAYQTQAWRNLLQQPADMMDPAGTGSERFLYYWTKQNYEPYGAPVSMLIPPLYYNENDVSSIASLKTAINTYVEESIAKFVTGQMSVDRDWDRFQTELKNLGVDRYLQIIQSTYDQSAFAKK